MAVAVNMADGVDGMDGMVRRLAARLDELEGSHKQLEDENERLRGRVEALEACTTQLRAACEDLTLKVDVVRQPRLRTSTQRVLGTFELLEHILLRCPTKQLYQLPRVCSTFAAVLAASAPLRSRRFQSATDAVAPDVNLAERPHLWPTLRLNQYWDETWQIHHSRVSIGLRVSRVSREQMTFRITDDLAATFEYRVTSVGDTLAALDRTNTSRGKSYLTRPALPTRVGVSFLDTSILRDKQEYLRACRSPAEVPPNVTAQARIRAATVREMLQVASMLHRYHREKWAWDREARSWTTSGAVEEDRDTMRLLLDKPVYSGWRAVQPRSGHLVFDT